MNSQEIISFAARCLIDNERQFVFPGELGERDGEWIEVIFLVPEALIIDPPDIRVLVNSKLNSAKIIRQI